MAGELSGRKVAILAADGVERVELEQPRGAVTDAGAEVELLSIHVGEIAARNNDLEDAGRRGVRRGAPRGARVRSRSVMKAAVYNGPRDVAVKDIDDSRIEQPTDAIVRITTTNICGSDVHMYEGPTDFEKGSGGSSATRTSVRSSILHAPYGRSAAVRDAVSLPRIDGRVAVIRRRHGF